MTLKLQRLIVVCAVVATFAGSILCAARSKGTSDADRRKADYIFMEALRQRALDNYNGYFELLQRAYALDPTNTAVGQDLGYYYLLLSSDNSDLGTRGYELMKRHFDANPADYYSSIFYGRIVDELRLQDESLRVWSTLDSLYPNKPDLTAKLAETYAKSANPADWEKALSTIARLEESNGKDLGLTSQRIRIYMLRRDTASVEGELQSLLQYSPESVQNRVYIGDVYMALGKPDSAIAYYNRACSLDATSGLAHYRRAAYYHDTNDSINYDREIVEALSQADLDVDVKKEFLRTYVSDNYSDSLRHHNIDSIFDAVLELHPRDVDIRDLYGAYLYSTGRTEACIEQAHYAIDIDPTKSKRWQLLITCLSILQDYDGAIAEGQRALEYLPDDAAIYTSIGSTALIGEKYDVAEEMFTKSLEKASPTDYETRSDIFTSLADTYYYQDKIDEAFSYYRQAIETNPKNYLAKNNYAYFMACNDTDLDLAEQYAFDAITAQPQNATALDTYAWVLFKQKKYAEAKRYIDKTLQIDDEPQAELFDHAGDIYYWNQLTDEALDFWRKALKLDPDNATLRRKVNNKAYYKSAE